MRRLLPTSILISSALALCGCPESETNDSGSIPYADLPREAAETYCHVILECGSFGDSELALARVFFDDAAECAAVLRPGLAREIAEMTPLIASGRVRYDGSRARACLNEVRRACAGLDDGGPCRDVFSGTIALGGACSGSDECAGDAYCEYGMASGDCGVCAARAPIGGSCETASCTKTVASDCDYDGEAPVCVEVRLAGPAGAGQACGRTTSGSVQTETSCAAALTCVRGESDAGVCAELPPAGGTCTDDGGLCQGDQICIDGRCRAITVQATEGATCSEATLTVCDPFERLQCMDGTCRRLGDGGAGSACTGNDAFEDVGCNEGLVCVDDVCTTPLPDGAACESDSACASGSCSPAGTCTSEAPSCG